MKYFFILCTLLTLNSCNKEDQNKNPRQIIDRTIENAGGELYKNASIEFKFRNHTYKSIRNNGEFYLERARLDSVGNIRDVLSNTGYQRFIDESPVQVPDSMALRYSSSINSVHYFVHLPYALNDMAVNKKFIEETIVEGEPYYKIEITFQQEGGGEDHHDEFMYWIHMEKYTIDYLAYKFRVNQGGIRFRAAFNPRVIKGIRFVDYYNYSFKDFNTPLKDLDVLYQDGKLELLSTIETEIMNVEVR